MPETIPYAPFASGPAAGSSEFISTLRADTAGCRLSIGRFCLRRALNASQIREAAQTFDADHHFVSAAKKLLNGKSPAYKKVTGILSRARSYWVSLTVPFPILGIRLIRRSKMNDFDAQLQSFKAELAEATAELDAAYPEMRERAREQLGELFNEHEYPEKLGPTFDLSWSFENVEPPDYLKTLNPELYQREQEKIAKRFEEAVTAAEEVLTRQLHELVSGLLERLKGGGKMLRASAVDGFGEFLQRFRDLGITSNEQLNALVAQTEQIVGGVDVKELRKNVALQTSIIEQFDAVHATLDQMVVPQPVRQFSFDEEDESEPQPEQLSQSA